MGLDLTSTTSLPKLWMSARWPWCRMPLCSSPSSQSGLALQLPKSSHWVQSVWQNGQLRCVTCCLLKLDFWACLLVVVMTPSLDASEKALTRGAIVADIGLGLGSPQGLRLYQCSPGRSS
eukprot:6457319-Amphidinium_carterae.2